MSGRITNYFSRYRYSVILLKQLVKTEFKLRYQGSVLGYLWSLLKPLALFAILLLVFSKFLRVGDGVENFPVYLLLGIVTWTYFAEVTVSGINSIVSRGELLRKINFPKYVIVLAGSLSALINFSINMIVVLLFMYFNGVDFRLELLLVPVVVLQLFIFSLSISFFLSALYVKFRDVSYIWEVVMQAAFYATPILFPVSFIMGYSVAAAKIIMLSPMTQMIQDIRYMMITEESVRVDQVFGNHWIRLIPYGLTVLFALLSILYFRSRSRSFAENL